MSLKKIHIPPTWNSEGRFALCGEAGDTNYHIWIDSNYNPEGFEEEDPVIHANRKDYKGNIRRIGLKTKTGSQIAASLIAYAKNFSLVEEAIKKRKESEEKQKVANAARAQKRAEKDIAHNTLIFIAKTLRNPRFVTNDPCLIELKTKAIAALEKLEL